MRKPRLLARLSVSVDSAWSPVSVWPFPGTLVSSHVPKMCTPGERACLHCPSLSECECARGPAMEGRPVQGGCLLCALSCWDRLRPSVTLNWSKQVGKNYLTNS